MDVLLRDSGARESESDSAANRLFQDFMEYTRKPEKLEAALKSVSQEVSWQVEHYAKQLWQMRDGLRETIRALSRECETGSKPDNTRNKTYDWITAINLTTDFTVGDRLCGVPQRMKEFTDFAAKTKGSSVAFVVQAAFLEGPKPKDGEKKPDNQKYRLERYLIADGTIKKLETLPSTGYAKDLEGLLSYTTKNFQCKKLGLIVDSHGSGNEGLSGDTGEMTLKQLKESIVTGLGPNGKSKLDMLNFDCCSMAQDGVVRVISTVAKDFVASANKIQTDGQNLVKTLDELTKNPSMDGNQYAEQFIKTARAEGATPQNPDKWVAVRTLAHFKSDKVAAFEKEFDALGDKLSAVLDLPGGRHAIGAVLNDTYRYNDWGDNAHEWDTGTKADLKDFLNATKKAIEDKKIPDKDGSLKKAVETALEKMNEMTSYFGDAYANNFHKKGGLSTYMPKASIRDIENGARRRSNAGLLAVQAERFLTGYKSDQDRRDKIGTLHYSLADVEMEFKGEPKSDVLLKPLRDAHDTLKNASTQKEFQDAIKEFFSHCKTLEQTAFYKDKFAEAKKQLKKETVHLDDVNLVSNSTGWGRFQLKLKDPR
jgi:hypothetical protein